MSTTWQSSKAYNFRWRVQVQSGELSCFSSFPTCCLAQFGHPRLLEKRSRILIIFGILTHVHHNAPSTYFLAFRYKKYSKYVYRSSALDEGEETSVFEEASVFGLMGHGLVGLNPAGTYSSFTSYCPCSVL